MGVRAVFEVVQWLFARPQLSNYFRCDDPAMQIKIIHPRLAFSGLGAHL